MNSKYETLQVHYNEPTLLVKFNRPEKANAINNKMAAELDEILLYLRNNQSCKYVVFTGNGGHFSAGADLVEANELLKDNDNLVAILRNDQLARIDFMRKLDEMDQITIAAINGAMYGAGFATAMACDFRIMADNATACLPETQRGMFFTAGCTGRLVNLVGPAKAKELIMLGEVINAEESLKIGLVNKVVPSDLLMEQVQKMILQLEKSPFLPIKITKRIVNTSISTNDSSLAYESDLLELLFLKNDMSKTMVSFKSI